jgi:hypothetical protein
VTRTAVPARALRATVDVRPYLGDSAYGPRFAETRPVKCVIDEGRRIVRDREGRETVSETTVYVHPRDRAAFPIESEVTVDGRATTVLAVKAHRGARGGEALIEVTLR